MKEDESYILRGIMEGREPAFARLFESYYRILSVFACKYVDDMDTAREIVQDLFVHMYDHRKSLVINSSLKSYLFQAVRNRCLNHLKHQRIQEKARELIRSHFEEHVDPEALVRETEIEHLVFTVVEGLPPRCRRVFKMSRMEGKKNGEIATAMGISTRTVETQISKALRILRKRLREQG